MSPISIKDGEAQVLADPRHTLEEGLVASGFLLGELVELFFQGGDLGVEVTDHRQVVRQSDLAQGMILGGQQLLLPGIVK